MISYSNTSVLDIPFPVGLCGISQSSQPCGKDSVYLVLCESSVGALKDHRTWHISPHVWTGGQWKHKCFILDAKIAAQTPNSKLIQKCLHHPQCIVTKMELYVFLSAILGLPLSFSHILEALMIWRQSFTLPPTSINLLFVPFTYFFTISHNTLYSLVLCATQMFNPISSSLFLAFAVSHREAEGIWKSSSSLSSPHSVFFPSQTVGSIKHMTFWGNTTAPLSLICLGSLSPSSLFELLQALSSRVHFSCGLNYILKLLVQPWFKQLQNEYRISTNMSLC